MNCSKFVIVFVLLLLLDVPVHSESVLLYSKRSIGESRQERYVTPILRISIEYPDHSGAKFGETAIWSNEQTGSVDFYSLNPTNFNVFVNFATNGIPERIKRCRLWGGRTSCITVDESQVLGHTPDLFAYQIDFIRLVVNTIEMSFDGTWSSCFVDYTWEFWGQSLAIPTENQTWGKVKSLYQ